MNAVTRYPAFGEDEHARCEAATFDARVRRLPPGCEESPGALGADSLLLGIRGEPQVTVEGDVHALARYDLLSVRAGASRRCANAGPGDALVLEVVERGAGGDDAVARPAAVHLTWAESQRGFALRSPLADRQGYRRFSGPFIETSGLKTHLVRLPAGEGSPWHALPGDLLLLQLEGEVEFRAAGEDARLAPLDALAIPGGVPYTYATVGPAEALFFDVFERPRPGAPPAYYADDPGWPVRDDAPLLEVTGGERR